MIVECHGSKRRRGGGFAVVILFLFISDGKVSMGSWRDLVLLERLCDGEI